MTKKEADARAKEWVKRFAVTRAGAFKEQSKEVLMRHAYATALLNAAKPKKT